MSGRRIEQRQSDGRRRMKPRMPSAMWQQDDISTPHLLGVQKNIQYMSGRLAFKLSSWSNASKSVNSVMTRRNEQRKLGENVLWNWWRTGSYIRSCGGNQSPKYSNARRRPSSWWRQSTSTARRPDARRNSLSAYRRQQFIVRRQLRSKLMRFILDDSLDMPSSA